MKFSLILFFIGMISINIVSCNSAEKFKVEVAEIDSCLAILDTIESNFDGIEFDSLAIIVTHIKSNEKIIKDNYISDTINEELGSNMNKCKGIRKFFKDPGAERNKLKREILDLNAQFENLKSDITDGILTKEKIDLYINNEKNDLRIFRSSFDEYYIKQLKTFEIYYTIVPQVDTFIEVMMSGNEEIES